MTKTFHESGLPMRKNASCQNSRKESPKREEHLAVQREQVKCQLRWTRDRTARQLQSVVEHVPRSVCDHGVKKKKKKKRQEEDLRQCIERPKDAWEPTASKTEAISETALQLSQSSNTKGQHLEQYRDSLLSLAKEHGWTKDIDEWPKFARKNRERL